MIKRFLAACLSLMLLLPLFAQAEDAPDPETSYTLMGLERSTTRDWNVNRFFTRMEERTGIHFTFRQYSDDASYQQAKDDAFSSGALPDVFFKANLSPQEEMKYLKDGSLVDLAPLLEEYAPTLHTILEARPDWKRIITQPDGAIASLPVLNGADRQCCIWINRAWLEALNLPMPQTIDELTEVLHAFQSGDPNGNGKADEIPLSIVGPWEAKFLLHAWGLTPNDYNIYVDDNGIVQFAPFDPAYRSFVEWLQMAQNESLITSDSFRLTQASRTTELTTTDTDAPITIGCMITYAPYTLIDIDKSSEYAVLIPLEYDGERVYRQLLNGVGRGAFAVTSACDDVPAMLQWVDYLYTEEGGRLAFAGLQGEDYEISEDGAWRWSINDDYGRLSEIAENSLIADDALTPGLEPAAFMRNSEITADNYVRRQVDTIREYLVEPFPSTWPTDEAREERIASLQLSIATYLDTFIADFASGRTVLDDESWDAFITSLQALGVDEFVSLWQQKYDELPSDQP